MAITLTNIHKRRIVNQIEHNLVGLQRDMHANAEAHKVMAESRSVPLKTLQTYISDCAAEYLKRLQWVIDWYDNSTRRQRALDAIEKAGWEADEIVGLTTELRTVAVGLRDADISSYERIVTVCDGIMGAVDKPESLWPE